MYDAPIGGEFSSPPAEEPPLPRLVKHPGGSAGIKRLDQHVIERQITGIERNLLEYCFGVLGTACEEVRPAYLCGKRHIESLPECFPSPPILAARTHLRSSALMNHF